MKQKWPNDADGNVLRQLSKRGVPMDRPLMVDFEIDCDTWPIEDEALTRLRERYPEAIVEVFDDEKYLLLQCSHTLSHEWVLEMQLSISRLMAAAGGKCDSWGVMWPQDI